MTDTDQTSAADPALDALDTISDSLFDPREAGKATTYDVATIRDALADRITPAEAQLAFEWMDDLTESGRIPSPEAAALIARLGRIADRDSEAGR